MAVSQIIDVLCTIAISGFCKCPVVWHFVARIGNSCMNADGFMHRADRSGGSRDHGQSHHGREAKKKFLFHNGTIPFLYVTLLC